MVKYSRGGATRQWLGRFGVAAPYGKLIDLASVCRHGSDGTFRIGEPNAMEAGECDRRGSKVPSATRSDRRTLAIEATG